MSLQSGQTTVRAGARFVHGYFGALVIIVLVPSLLIAGWLAVRAASAARLQIESNAQLQVRALAAAIDHEIASMQNLLAALASSHFLQDRDLEAFYRQATEISRQLKIQIVLRDPKIDGQLLNTSFPWGASLPRAVPAECLRAEAESQRSGKPAVSDVFLNPMLKQHIVNVVVPVAHGGATPYFLSAGIRSEKFTDTLRNWQLDNSWTATIIDKSDVIVARSDDPNDFVGTPITAKSGGIVRATARANEGIKIGTSRDGIDFHWFFHRSELSGWRLSVGVPDRVLEAPSKLAITSFATAGGLLLVVGVAFAYGLGGRVSKAMGVLRVAAITERQRGEEQFQALFESVANGIVAVDGTGVIVLVNAQMEQMFGYLREELIGRSVETLVPTRMRQGHAEVRKAFALSPQARPMGARHDLFGQRKDGSEFPIEIGLNPIRTVAGDMVMATVVDITQRKQAAARLSLALAERDDLRRRFMRAQEEERLRLAHELHDQTGQSLTAVMLELKGMESLVNEGGRDRLRLLRKQLELMGKSLHHVAWELRPASIDELGLASALSNYVSEWGSQIDIAADFHCSVGKLDELADDVRTTIYRLVQEGLTNIAKHAAGATAVSVVIDRTDKVLRLAIEDNGPGFDSTPPAETAGERKNAGLGLAGMRERLSLIGGEVEIESSIGIGTTIYIRIPVANERATV